MAVTRRLFFLLATGYCLLLFHKDAFVVEGVAAALGDGLDGEGAVGPVHPLARDEDGLGSALRRLVDDLVLDDEAPVVRHPAGGALALRRGSVLGGVRRGGRGELRLLAVERVGFLDDALALRVGDFQLDADPVAVLHDRKRLLHVGRDAVAACLVELPSAAEVRVGAGGGDGEHRGRGEQQAGGDGERCLESHLRGLLHHFEKYFATVAALGFAVSFETTNIKSAETSTIGTTGMKPKTLVPEGVRASTSVAPTDQ